MTSSVSYPERPSTATADIIGIEAVTGEIMKLDQWDKVVWDPFSFLVVRQTSNWRI